MLIPDSFGIWEDKCLVIFFGVIVQINVFFCSFTMLSDVFRLRGRDDCQTYNNGMFRHCTADAHSHHRLRRFSTIAIVESIITHYPHIPLYILAYDGYGNGT